MANERVTVSLAWIPVEDAGVDTLDGADRILVYSPRPMDYPPIQDGSRDSDGIWRDGEGLRMIGVTHFAYFPQGPTKTGEA